jgi:hypothetical protein
MPQEFAGRVLRTTVGMCVLCTAVGMCVLRTTVGL